MLVALFRRAARRVQRISQQYQAGHRQGWITGSHLRRDPAAHRLSTNEEKSGSGRDFGARGLDHRSIARFERRSAIGDLPPLLRVQKVESENVQTKLGERAREVDHERTLLAGAGAVTED